MEEFPELEKERSERSSRLLRSALERARKVDQELLGTGRGPQRQQNGAGEGQRGLLGSQTKRSALQWHGVGAVTAKRSRPRDVTLDVSGRPFRTRQDVLSAFGPSPFFEAELEDFSSEEPIVLGCQERAFELLHGALAVARRDLTAGLRALRDGLAGPSGEELGDLVDFLGLRWLRGAPPRRAPSGLQDAKGTLGIARLKALAGSGVLRHLAGRSLLPTGFGGFAAPRRGEEGAIYVARETSWARSLSKEQDVSQVLCLRSAPLSPDASPCLQGCFQPSVLRDGDRLVFDVGRARFLHLDCLVLGLTAMEGRDEEVRVHLEAGGAPGAGPSCEASGRARHREHGFEPNGGGGWTPAPQTCSALLVSAEGSGEPLVDRLFAATVQVPGGGTLGLYHAELFGTLLEAPAGLRPTEEPAAPFAFDHRSTTRCCQSQDSFYPEEMGFLRSFGLLDPAMEQELEELDWDYDEE